MTIKEIAQMAGVSSAAVSRYLNGGYVSEEKKEQIKKVIEETGYQPSAQARRTDQKGDRGNGLPAFGPGQDPADQAGLSGRRGGS